MTSTDQIPERCSEDLKLSGWRVWSGCADSDTAPRTDWKRFQKEVGVWRRRIARALLGVRVLSAVTNSKTLSEVRTTKRLWGGGASAFGGGSNAFKASSQRQSGVGTTSSAFGGGGRFGSAAKTSPFGSGGTAQNAFGDTTNRFAALADNPTPPPAPDYPASCDPRLASSGGLRRAFTMAKGSDMPDVFGKDVPSAAEGPL
ncbi:hypothetical protein HDU96_006841 [Phlyctochytrium bullatum]|nr:hypothetical protein HDU96_006841 [Phlyctochytrium bullatum]